MTQLDRKVIAITDDRYERTLVIPSGKDNYQISQAFFGISGELQIRNMITLTKEQQRRLMEIFKTNE